MKRVINLIAIAMVVLASGLFAWDANAVTIEILCSQSELGCTQYGGDPNGKTLDGTIFTANPNPSEPSTGTGVFEPFKRVQEPTGGDGLQNGFNTEEHDPDINFDTKDGSDWTRSVLFGELGTIIIDGTSYYVLQLDANQTSKGTALDNQITITNMEIFIAGDLRLANPEDFCALNPLSPDCVGTGGTGYSGTLFDSSSTDRLLGHLPVWSLDNGNGDVSVILQASICDTPGQCGSGHGDMDVFIPQSLLSGSSTDYFVLYTEYSGANDGFEEWRFQAGPAEVPEPSSLLLLSSGLVGLGLWGRRRFKARA